MTVHLTGKNRTVCIIRARTATILPGDGILVVHGLDGTEGRYKLSDLVAVSLEEEHS